MSLQQYTVLLTACLVWRLLRLDLQNLSVGLHRYAKNSNFFIKRIRGIIRCATDCLFVGLKVTSMSPTESWSGPHRHAHNGIFTFFLKPTPCITLSWRHAVLFSVWFLWLFLLLLQDLWAGLGATSARGTSPLPRRYIKWTPPRRSVRRFPDNCRWMRK
jgi:hypothetical protein